MQSSIEAAESQAGIHRAGLEHELILAKNEIDNIKMVADAARERHDLLLEQEADLRRDALRRVNETSSAALNDLREKHSEEIQYITSQHERSIANAYLHDVEKYLQDNRAQFPLWHYNEKNASARQPDPRIRGVDKTDFNHPHGNVTDQSLYVMNQLL